MSMKHSPSEQPRGGVSQVLVFREGQSVTVTFAADLRSPLLRKFDYWQYLPDDAPIIEVDWEKVSPEYICAACDSNGSVYFYAGAPWVENDSWATHGEYEVGYIEGDSIDTTVFLSQTIGTEDWKRSLTWRPGHETKETACV